MVPGQLAVRWERQDVRLVMWLSGELDQATVMLLDREVDRRAVGMMHLVVDLTGLEFIDSAGSDALVGIHWRVSKRGDHLSFRHGAADRATAAGAHPLGPTAFSLGGPGGARARRRLLLCARDRVR